MNVDCAILGYDLEITFYHAASLYKANELADACESGLIDMTVCIIPTEKDRYPLHELLTFAFIGWDEKSLLKVWAELDRAIPEFHKEITKNYEEDV